MALRIEIDELRCCASGQCHLAAPTVFDQREEDGAVLLIDPTPNDSLRDAVLEAAQLCPCRVIQVWDD